jgi:hypothetical protein
VTVQVRVWEMRKGRMWPRNCGRGACACLLPLTPRLWNFYVIIVIIIATIVLRHCYHVIKSAVFTYCVGEAAHHQLTVTGTTKLVGGEPLELVRVALLQEHFALSCHSIAPQYLATVSRSVYLDSISHCICKSLPYLAAASCRIQRTALKKRAVSRLNSSESALRRAA